MSIDGEVTQPMLTLTETETTFILSIDSSIVASDAKDLDSIKHNNERYVEVSKSFVPQWPQRRDSPPLVV